MPMARRLLLVDDDDAIREIARISLERVGGWDVVAAGSGEAAVEIVEDGGLFDLVVLDVMMPGIDGPTTLGRLRGHLPPTVPVIFLTAKLQAADRARLLGLGAVGVVAKPFDPMALPAEIDSILGV
jgi:two-component system, OmpR family, response regulator